LEQKQTGQGSRTGRATSNMMSHRSGGLSFREQSCSKRCREASNDASVQKILKYNLSPKFQHLKASFMNTDKAVKKL